MKSLPSSLKSKREGNASWVGSATSQFRNTLHLIWHRYVSVYGIHSELGFTVFSLFLKQLSFQILVNALCYKDGGFFFFSWNLLSLNLRTSVLPICMVLQSSHLYVTYRCSYSISSPEVLKFRVLLRQMCCRKQICKECYSQFRFFWL